MSTSENPRANLAEVAERAKVSIATASKVVNGRPDVGAETRERVEAVIEELGYRGPARPAQSASVEVLVDVLTSAYAMELLRGVALAAEEHDIDVVVGRVRRRTSRGSEETPAGFAQRLAAGRRLGAIVVTAGLDPEQYGLLARARVPLVVIDPVETAGDGAVSVGSTNWLGGRSAAQHLLELGHRRLGAIGGPAASLAATARLDGFRSAVEGVGLSLDPRFVRRVGFDHDDARDVAEQWLRLPDAPTALLASSDAQAMGVLEAARRVGLRVPDDLSVVSYDDTPLASWAHPPLTAVRQPLQDIGRRALTTILELHAGRAPESPHIEIATSLIARDSTAAPRSTEPFLREVSS